LHWSRLQEADQQRWQASGSALAELPRLLSKTKRPAATRSAKPERDGIWRGRHGPAQYDQLAMAVQQRRPRPRRRSFQAAQQAGEALLREQVEEGDIADVVARWTGIPDAKRAAGRRAPRIA